MADFGYTMSEGMVTSKPVSVNVSPNFSTARAIEGIVQNINSGLNYVKEQNEQDYKLELAKQEKRKLFHDQEMAKLQTYEEKTAYFNDVMKPDVVERYKGGTQWSQMLRDNGAISLASTQKGLIDSATNLQQLKLTNDTQSYAQNLVIEGLNSNDPIAIQKNIDTLTEKANEIGLVNNEVSQKLSAAVRESAFKLTNHLTQLNRENEIADNLQENEQFIINTVARTGSFGSSAWATVKANINSLDIPRAKKNKLLSTKSEEIFRSLSSYYNEQPNSWENSQNYLNAITAFSKVDKMSADKAYYTTAKNNAELYQKRIQQKEEETFNKILSNLSLSEQEVTEAGNLFMSHGSITKEAFDAGMAKRASAGKAAKIGDRALNALLGNNTQELQALVLEGHGGAVATQASSYLNMFGQTSEAQYGRDGADYMVLNQWKEWYDKGIISKDIPYIDNNLNALTNGSPITMDSLATFINLGNQTKAFGYPFPSEKVGILHRGLSGLANLGYTPEEILTTYKESLMPHKKTKFTTEELNITIDNVLNQNDTFSFDLEPYNYKMMKDAISDGVAFLMTLGIPEQDIADQASDMFKELYVETNPFKRVGNRIFIPKVGRINTVQSVDRLLNYFGDGSVVQPMDINRPQGNWMVLRPDGTYNEYPFERMEFIAITQRFGTPEQFKAFLEEGK